MAINKNHEFEELNGVKCAIVEKNVKPDRVAFLKTLLTFNKLEVVVVPTPAPKAAPAAAPKAEEGAAAPPPPPPPPPAPETFTVGVTDYTFNSTNAIFGRQLKTPNGHVVTQAYWKQLEAESHDEVPYYEFKG